MSQRVMDEKITGCSDVVLKTNILVLRNIEDKNSLDLKESLVYINDRLTCTLCSMDK